MSTYLGVYPAGSEEWRAHRNEKVGGSDVAAIVGLSPWVSPYTLWCERKGLVEPQETNQAMTWGTRLEPVIVEAFIDAHPDLFVKYVPGAVYAHPDRDWQVASPDALIYGDDWAQPTTGLEVKTARYADGWADGVPAYYECQVQWCMNVMGVDSWHVAVLFAGSDYREYVIEANPAFQELLVGAASDFLDSLAADQPPALDHWESTHLTVRRQHPEIEDEDAEIPADLAEDLAVAVAAYKDAEDRKREACTRVLAAMGTAKTAVSDGRKVASRRSQKGGTPFLVPDKTLLTAHA